MHLNTVDQSPRGLQRLDTTLRRRQSLPQPGDLLAIDRSF
jgi:hypothetical protein